MLKKRFFGVVIALLIAAGILPGCSSQGVSPTGLQLTEISSQSALKLIEENTSNRDFIILDVRTAAEFNDGHLSGAVNSDVNLPTFSEEVGKLDKNKTFLVYCRTGNRSRTAVQIMEKSGFKRIYHLTNGITEWTGAGLPVVR